MAHQNLDGSKLIPIIQEGGSKWMPDYMRVNPFLNESPFRHGFDKAINRLRRYNSLFIRTLLPQCLKDRPSRINPVNRGFEIIPDRNHGIGMPRYSPELLSFPNNINDSLIPIGLEILDLQAASFGFSQSGGEQGQ